MRQEWAARSSGRWTMSAVALTDTETLVTADVLLVMPEDGFRYELVKGELRRMPPAGGEHGAISITIGGLLFQHLRDSRLGRAFGAETGFKIASDPDTVRAPDAAFVCRERIPEGGLPRGYFPGAPDLAVEVISPGDTYAEVEEKVLEWLDAGTRMVILLNPRRRTATVYRSRSEVTVLGEADELTGGDVVPGFACRVAELFQ
jgi:Uma2 family endonuclease